MVVSGEIYCIIPSKIENRDKCDLECNDIIFKVGQSTQGGFKRISSYGNKSALLGRYAVENPKYAEKKLLQFIREKDYYKVFQGNEYFIGRLKYILIDFHEFMQGYIQEENIEKQKQLEITLNNEAYLKLKKENEELKRRLEVMESQASRLFETSSEESESSEDNEKMGVKRGRVNEELKKMDVRAFLSRKKDRGV